MDLVQVHTDFGKFHCGSVHNNHVHPWLLTPERLRCQGKNFNSNFNWECIVLTSGSVHLLGQTLHTYSSLTVGSLVRSIWNWGAGIICMKQLLRLSPCSNCIGQVELLMAPLALTTLHHTISSRKNFWITSACLRSGDLDRSPLSLARFWFFLHSRSLFLKLKYMQSKSMQYQMKVPLPPLPPAQVIYSCQSPWLLWGMYWVQHWPSSG